MDIWHIGGIGIAALAAAAFGSMLGLGGGVFLVPLLTLFLGVDPHVAVGASAVCVVTNAVGGSSVHMSSGFTNIRMAVLLECLTVIGATIGALIALSVGANTINVLLGLVLLYSAFSMLRQRRMVPAPPEPDAPDPFGLRDAYFDRPTQQVVEYVPSHIGVGMAVSSLAGVLSGMLGIGGGVIKVPVMNLIMKIPVKAAAGTSGFMVGITAVATAAVFYANGRINPQVVVPAMIGVFLGSQVGSQVTRRMHTQRLVLVFVIVLTYLGGSLILKAMGIGFGRS